MFKVQPMAVTRVVDGTGSSVEPPLDQEWSEQVKMSWCLGVTNMESGLELSVSMYQSLNEPGIAEYAITGHRFSLGGQEFHEAWKTLSQLSMGARMMTHKIGKQFLALSDAESPEGPKNERAAALWDAGHYVLAHGSDHPESKVTA